MNGTRDAFYPSPKLLFLRYQVQLISVRRTKNVNDDSDEHYRLDTPLLAHGESKFAIGSTLRYLHYKRK